jgi:hypothetical protein
MGSKKVVLIKVMLEFQTKKNLPLKGRVVTQRPGIPLQIFYHKKIVE